MSKWLLLMALLLPAAGFAESLECAAATRVEFADIADGFARDKGADINATYQAVQTAAVDKAFAKMTRIVEDCDYFGGTLHRDAAWRRTPQGPAKACFQLGNGDYHCKVHASKHALCCIPD